MLRCEELGPETPGAAVIWLHGLGASGHDFVPVVPHLDQEGTRFVFPHAPARPVTINMGMVMPSWYDIRHLEPGPDRESGADIHESARDIVTLIQREVERGIPESRIILAGFSQGGALALHVGLRYPRALAGIMVLSAYELLADSRDREAHPANHPTPMLFCHGRFDGVVPIGRGRTAYQISVEEGRACEWYDFAMDHEVCMDEIDVIRQWMNSRLGGGSA